MVPAGDLRLTKKASTIASSRRTGPASTCDTPSPPGMASKERGIQLAAGGDGGEEEGGGESVRRICRLPISEQQMDRIEVTPGSAAAHGSAAPGGATPGSAAARGENSARPDGVASVTAVMAVTAVTDGEATSERLYRHGSMLLRGRLELEQSWKAVAAERLQGKSGKSSSAARSEHEESVEGAACERLWASAQEQQRRQQARIEAAQADESHTHTPGLHRTTMSAGTMAAGMSPPVFTSPSTHQHPQMRATLDREARSSGGRASGGGVAMAADANASSSTPSVVSRAEAEAKAAQRHFEAMVRMQQKEVRADSTWPRLRVLPRTKL